MTLPGLNEAGARVYRRLLGYVRPNRGVMLAAMLAALVHVAATGSVPLLMEAVIERLEQGSAGGAAWHMPVVIIIVFTVRSAMNFLMVYGLSWVGRAVIRDLRSEVFEHYLALPARYFDVNATGTLLSKLTYNTEQVAEAMSNAIIVLVRDSLTIVVLIGMMLYYSLGLTLVVAVVGPVVVALIGLMSRAFRRHSTRIQGSMGDVTRVTEQALQGNRVVKMFEGQRFEQQRFDAINTRNFRLNLRLAATRAAGDSLTQYTVILGVAAVIFVAFSDWFLTGLTAPIFIGFITAMGALLAPLKRLVNINVAVQRGIAAADSLFEVLDEPAEHDGGGAPLERAVGDVEYRDVSFRYTPGGPEVLSDVNLTIPAGATVALVGRSGSGKSTLAGLLPRFYEVTAGAILLDGRDIRDYGLRDLRRQIAFVSQDVVLFEGTIAENIAYGGLAGLDRGAIERVADAAYVTEFAHELGDGLDAQVGERGMRLSGGQRQRIAIARALLKDAPILMLDEATSALDSESERRVQQALERLMEGRTTLVIAHRLSTIERADLIVVMKEGTIVESGAHHELLEQAGYYAALHRMQFAD